MAGGCPSFSVVSMNVARPNLSCRRDFDLPEAHVVEAGETLQ